MPDAIRSGMPDTTQVPERLGAWLASDHDQIERLLVRLIEAFDTGDRDVAAAAFRDAERRVLDHFAIEDKVVLPELAPHYPEEAQAIAEEHRAMRAVLDEIGINVDLHAARASAIRALVDRLRAHARREEALLYRWIDRASAQPELRARLENAFMPHGRSPVPPVT
jgi:hypothetical protein